LKLAKQQEEFRQQQAGKDVARGGPDDTHSFKSETPLPPGWQEVPDPSGSGDAYFWNQVRAIVLTMCKVSRPCFDRASVPKFGACEIGFLGLTG
jgi:hypothetical protein